MADERIDSIYIENASRYSWEASMGLKKIAVIGAGAMGAGIAQVMAAASTEVVLVDVAPEFVESGMKRIDGRLGSDVKKGRMTNEEKDRVKAHIKGTTRQEDAADTDLIVEAIIEERKVKGDLFRNLNRICGPDTLFATNTSTLSVTDLATLSGRPTHFLGLHFFNPVHAMKLVEVIPGLDTSTHAVTAATDTVKAIKKVPVVVQDCPGFLVNRILLSYMNEVLVAVEEGVDPTVIDGEAKKAGFPMGPLEVSDMVGWGVSNHTFPILHEAYGERFPVVALVPTLNAAGRLGLKTGKGVYVDGRVDDEFRAMVAGLQTKKSVAPFSFDRLMLKQVNEAIYCVQEGVSSAADIDRAMVLGTGFPNEGGVGGPLHWADDKGLDWVLYRLEELTGSEGLRFWPHHLLKTYVSAGRLGKKAGKGFFEYGTARGA
jgi:3-hydroxyacyl-CoA dehydrogenase